MTRPWLTYPRKSRSVEVQLGAGVYVVVRGPSLVKVHQPLETEMGVFMMVVRCPVPELAGVVVRLCGMWVGESTSARFLNMTI